MSNIENLDDNKNILIVKVNELKWKKKIRIILRMCEISNFETRLDLIISIDARFNLENYRWISDIYLSICVTHILLGYLTLMTIFYVLRGCYCYSIHFHTLNLEPIVTYLTHYKISSNLVSNFEILDNLVSHRKFWSHTPLNNIHFKNEHNYKGILNFNNFNRNIILAYSWAPSEI